MAGRAVQGEAVPVRVVFASEGVRGAQPHLFEGLSCWANWSRATA